MAKLPDRTLEQGIAMIRTAFDEKVPHARFARFSRVNIAK